MSSDTTGTEIEKTFTEWARRNTIGTAPSRWHLIRAADQMGNFLTRCGRDQTYRTFGTDLDGHTYTKSKLEFTTQKNIFKAVREFGTHDAKICEACYS